jgi:hypothetical protein
VKCDAHLCLCLGLGLGLCLGLCLCLCACARLVCIAVGFQRQVKGSLVVTFDCAGPRGGLGVPGTTAPYGTTAPPNSMMP